MVIGIATSGKPVHLSDQPHIDLFPLEFQSNPIEFFERYPRLTLNPNPLHLYFGSQYVKGKEVSGWKRVSSRSIHFLVFVTVLSALMLSRAATCHAEIVMMFVTCSVIHGYRGGSCFDATMSISNHPFT